ncbi:MAG: PD-(D/E)XK nuclease family protein [Pseudohaliea sp.]
MATIKLSSKPGVYELPSYSLTGDLLGYLRCGLQYRYTRIGKMPSRAPVQLWFGNFIHGVLDEGFRIYDVERKAGKSSAEALAAIDADVVIETIESRLAAQGLVAWEPWLKTLGYARARVGLGELAEVLFPLIHRSEVRLTGARELKPLPPGTAFREADRYEMVGVIDVVTDIELSKPEVASNPIVKLVEDCLGKVPDHFEVIIDYKGSRRPALPPGKPTPKHPSLWDQYEWQVLTYADLRGRQPDAHPVKAGLLLYVNELLPLASDLEELRKEVAEGKTDIGASEKDIKAWLKVCRDQRKEASAILDAATGRDGAAAMKASLNLLPSPVPWDLRLKRALRIVPVEDPATGKSRIPDALKSFDDVVEWIETCRGREFHSGTIIKAWDRNSADEGTCAACDARTWCPDFSNETKPRLPAVKVAP